MIITDFETLRKIPIGTEVTLVMRFKIVKAEPTEDNPCCTCVFDSRGCMYCNHIARPDKEEVKFVKI